MMGVSRKYLRIVITVVAQLVIGLAGAVPRGALVKPAGYVFTPIAFLDDPALGGGNFTFDFEPYGINNRGEVTFVADVTTGGESVFLWSQEQFQRLRVLVNPPQVAAHSGQLTLGASPLTTAETWPLSSP